jgi:hypothetical protein
MESESFGCGNLFLFAVQLDFSIAFHSDPTVFPSSVVFNLSQKKKSQTNETCFKYLMSLVQGKSLCLFSNW